MTNDAAPIEPVALSSSDVTELSRRNRLRAELLLQLPTVDDIVPRRVTGISDPEAIIEVPAAFDGPYEPQALADWILTELDAEHEIVTGEQVRAIEISGAAGVVSASGEFMSYLIQLAEVLKQGHSIAGQWDLARTIHAEANRLQQLVAELLVGYPELQRMGAETPKPGLVLRGE